MEPVGVAALGAGGHRDQHPDVVALEAREYNVEGEGAIGLAALVRMGLRMNPDRVIVGEVRGEEVLPMLNAMSQGNDGSMCTLHADSWQGAFARLAMYAVSAPERLPLEATNLLVANAVDSWSTSPRARSVTTAAGDRWPGADGWRRYGRWSAPRGPGRVQRDLRVRPCQAAASRAGGAAAARHVGRAGRRSAAGTAGRGATDGMVGWLTSPPW